MITYTTTTFVNSVLTVAHVPQGNNTFSFNQILSLADLQMRTYIVPKIASCRENYWLTTQTYEIDPDINKYPIPSLAQGSAIVDVKVNVSQNLIHLTRLEISDLYSFQYSPIPGYGYYIEDQYVRLNPTSLVGNLIIWYYRMASQLVPTTSCAQITDVDYETGELTVGTVPSSFIGTGIQLDVVSQTPGFNVLIKNSVPDSIVGMVLTFDYVPPEVKVGDYICLSGQSCVIQCPLEWIEVLVQATVCKIYEIQGYLNKLAVAKKVLEEMLVNATNLVSPRTIESAKVIYSGGALLYPQNRGWLPVRSR